jgi:hypothetical protein
MTKGLPTATVARSGTHRPRPALVGAWQTYRDAVYQAQIVTGAAGSRYRFQAGYSSDEYFCEDDGMG